MFKRNLLSLAVMQAMMPAESGGASNTPPIPAPTEQPNAPQVDPAPNPNLVVNTGNVPTEQGRAWGQKILAAEQGEKIAEQTTYSMRIDGLLAVLKLSIPARIDFILGVQSAFGAVDGNRLAKGHQNYIGNLRRVVFANETFGDNWSVEKLTTHFAQAGMTYSEKLEKLPKTGERGGHNAGRAPIGDTKALVGEVIKAGTLTAPEIEKAIKVAEEAKKNPAQVPTADATKPQESTQQPNAPVPAKVEPPVSPTGPLSTMPEAPKAPNVSQQAEISTAQFVAMIAKAHDSQLDAIGAAYANRCKLSASPLWNDVGAAILDLLDAMEASTKPAEGEAPMAANG